MNLADVFTFVFSILGFIAVVIGYWLTAVGLFPHFVERCAERISAKPIRTGLLGGITLVPLLIFFLTVSGKSPKGGVKIAAIGMVLLAILLALWGSAGLAWRIGAGLKSMRDELEPWRRILRGGIALGLTFVLPVLGQFLMLPVTLFLGFGAFLTSLRAHAPEPAAPPFPVSAWPSPPQLPGVEAAPVAP